ncbi:MAG: hypothetical protein UV08_C0025G0006 [Parcubacteria group bacterium GW2011_GWA2_42_18]|nr:MAG: hypothetical protein UV08_C0025G0006 [Parcubacteria group bacterium GW2011_GWA2_42_18]
MKWANFLHIYQPPTQKPIWVKRIADESYRKIFNGLLEIPRARLSLNINSILCELLDQNGGIDVIKNIKKLVERGNIELTGSAKYHAFLPLLPESEIERQILLNEESLNKYFGRGWKKGGFFSPEMAYSKKVVEVAKRLGYKWIIIDEMAFPEGKEMRKDIVYEINGLKDFCVFFRERNLSFKILSASQIGVKSILKSLEPSMNQKDYTITGMDGETFGHHRPGLEHLFFDLLKDSRIEPLMISDVLDQFPKKEIIEPRDSTWATMPNHFKTNQPFFRWKNKDNVIQLYQWELANLAIDVVKRNEKQKTRELLDGAVHSDQFWWSSARPWWSLEMIERGAHDLRTVVNNSETSTDAEKQRAEELYKMIIYTGFEWQRSGLVDEISRNEDEEIRERLEEKEKLFVTKEEYQNMISNLKEQMKTAADSEEFHRAAMINETLTRRVILRVRIF